jgi:methyltransferase-like protein
LPNIELRAMDLMDVGADFGEFDYIVCHGVYSWTPRPVQDKILSICSERLAPQGVAYVSYNTYPGWHSRGMVREMVRYRVDHAAPPLERVCQARQFLDFLVRNSRDPKAIYSYVLREEAQLWEKASDSYILHEVLAEFNEPLYFHEFVGRLADHRLQYVSEAKLADSATMAPDEVRQKLSEWCGDLTSREQYLDFLRERTFRRSLLCRREVKLNREPQPELVRKFLLAARAIPAADEPDVGSSAAEQFRTNDGISFSTNNPWLKAALVELFEAWPRTYSFEQTCELARSRLAGSAAGEFDPFADPQLLQQPLLQCGMNGLIELHLHRSPEVVEISDKPRASRLARLHAEQGRRVTNLRHRELELAELDRQVLRRLDGEHDRAALVRAVSELAASGAIELEPRGETPEAAQAIEHALGESLRRLAGGGLLVG